MPVHRRSPPANVQRYTTTTTLTCASHYGQQDDKCLVTLNLAANNVGPEGAAAISRALRYNDTLEELDLSNNALEKLGGMALAEMLQVGRGGELF